MLLDDLNERLGRVLLAVKGRKLGTQKQYDMPSSSGSEDDVDVPVADRVEYAVQNSFVKYYIDSYSKANGVEWWPYCFFSNQGFARRVMWEVAFIRDKGVVFNVNKKGREVMQSTHALFDDLSGDPGDKDAASGTVDPPGTHWRASKKESARYKQDVLSVHAHKPVLDLERRVNERSQLFINLYVILYHWAKHDSMNIESDELVVSGPAMTDIASCVLGGVLLYPRIFSVVECLRQWSMLVGVDQVEDDLREIAENMFGGDGPVFAALTDGESRRLENDRIKRRYDLLNERVKAMLRSALETVFGRGSRIGKESARQIIVEYIARMQREPPKREKSGLKAGDLIGIDGLRVGSLVRRVRDMEFFPVFGDAMYASPVYEYPRQCMFVMKGPVVVCSDNDGDELRVASGLSKISKQSVDD